MLPLTTDRILALFELRRFGLPLLGPKTAEFLRRSAPAPSLAAACALLRQPIVAVGFAVPHFAVDDRLLPRACRRAHPQKVRRAFAHIVAAAALRGDPCGLHRPRRAYARRRFCRGRPRDRARPPWPSVTPRPNRCDVAAAARSATAVPLSSAFAPWAKASAVEASAGGAERALHCPAPFRPLRAARFSAAPLADMVKWPFNY